MHPKSAVLIARGTDPDHGGLGPVGALPVANRSVLEHAVDALARAGVKRIAMIAEPGAESECRRLASSEASRDAELTVATQTGKGLEEALTLAQPVVGDQPFVLHLGDSFCWDPDLRWSDGEFTAADVLVLVQPNPASGTNGTGPSRADSASARRIGPQHLGIYVVGPRFGEAACAVAQEEGVSAQARAAVTVLSEDGGRTHYTRQAECWRYGRTTGNLLDANQLALERLRRQEVAATVTDSELIGAVEIHPSAIIASSVIRGPVTIGAHSCIREAYVGPYTAIGDHVEVEGAEISYSVVMDGASVRNLRERLEASVIGPNARIFRDFRLPRALRIEIGAQAEVVLR